MQNDTRFKGGPKSKIHIKCITWGERQLYNKGFQRICWIIQVKEKNVNFSKHQARIKIAPIYKTLHTIHVISCTEPTWPIKADSTQYLSASKRPLSKSSAPQNKEKKWTLPEMQCPERKAVGASIQRLLSCDSMLLKKIVASSKGLDSSSLYVWRTSQ